LIKKSCLGIHYRTEGITAVLVHKQGSATELGPTFTLDGSAESADENISQLLGQLHQQLLRETSRVPPVALSLAGRFYQTEFFHSQFSDDRLLKQTLRFDLEENTTISAESNVFCYQRRGVAKDSGSDLLVHTIERNKIEAILDEFDQASFDALIAVPDVAGWICYLKRQNILPAGENLAVIAWAAETFYIIVLDREQQPLLARTAICPDDSQKAEMIATELNRSLALLSQDQQPQRILYHADGLAQDDIAKLEGQTKLKCSALDETDVTKAFAVGVALGYLYGEKQSDFRSDGMPPHSLIAGRNKALFALAGAASLLMLILIIVMNAHAKRYQKIESSAREQIEQAWLVAHPGQKLTRQTSKIPQDIKKLLARLHETAQDKTASTLPGSASHTLLLALQSLGQLAHNFDLTIDSLRVYPEKFSISGSVPNLKDVDRLHEISKQNPKLQIDSWDIQKVGSGDRTDPTNRRNFDIQLSLKKTTIAAKNK